MNASNLWSSLGEPTYGFSRGGQIVIPNYYSQIFTVIACQLNFGSQSYSNKTTSEEKKNFPDSDVPSDSMFSSVS